MHKLTVFTDTDKYILEFDQTPVLQQVLEEHKITMPHPCGGRGVCGKCAVEITGDVSVPDEKEMALGQRLSCRTRLYGDATVVLSTKQNLLAESSTESIKASEDCCAESLLGAAVDIGTTTVALSVYDLQTGSCLATATALNPQSTVAADVMARIDAGMSGHLTSLKEMITDCIENLALQSGYRDRIAKWVITGNTTMLYLFTGRNPKSLSSAPFLADHLFGEESEFLDKPLYIPKCMHAFVGADITCAVFESGMCNQKETALLCDIGTNGEIALWKDGKLYTASTAAGPAFEGAGISCGCQSIDGAIESVTPEGNHLKVQTIGNAPAVGLCGSGIIDALACLLDNGTIDETGAMEEDEVTICSSVVVTQKDIRSIQLAKAAISAGIKTLLQLTDTKESELSAFYIAGGFGSHLNIYSAIRIGLFPQSLASKVKVIGNAALKGAASMLTDESAKAGTQSLVLDATCINLGGMPEFNENYIDEMFFPEQTNSWYMLRLAKEINFSNFGLLKTESLVFKQEVRDMCATGRCGSYGKRWTCPPYCGTLDESVKKAQKFNSGIVLQMTGNMEDDFDVECMQETGQTVKDKLEAFVAHLREAKMECLPMTAGTCTKCDKCTCPDEPCRFPDQTFISMEAYGLIVNDTCVSAGIPYYYGPKTITFTTCVLFNE